MHLYKYSHVVYLVVSLYIHLILSLNFRDRSIKDSSLFFFMNRVIILLGQRVRSGTNFVGSTLHQHPDVVTLPPDKSLGEFNLFTNASIVEEVFDKVVKKSFGMNLSRQELSEFLENYGNCWLRVLLNKFKVSNDAVIFLKSPNILYLNLWQQAFPNSQISVICRDGRDNVISSVKASNDKRSWLTFSMKLKRFINYYSGRSFVNHTKAWVSTAHHVLSIPQNEQIKWFKYESLLDSENGIRDMLKHFQLDSSPKIIQECLKAPVVGSSYGVSTSKQSKPNWSPDYDKSKYKFTNKWQHWGFYKKAVFKKIAGKALIDLTYEKTSSW